MIKDLDAFYTDGALTIAGLLIFTAVFVGALYFTYKKDRKSFFEQLKTLPLE